MRTEFEMTKEQETTLLEACKPVLYLIVGGVAPRGPQENANDAWRDLGKTLGFKHMTVKPVSGKGVRYFTAEPTP